MKNFIRTYVYIYAECDIFLTRQILLLHLSFSVYLGRACGARGGAKAGLCSGKATIERDESSGREESVEMTELRRSRWGTELALRPSCRPFFSIDGAERGEKDREGRVSLLSAPACAVTSSVLEGIVLSGLDALLGKGCGKGVWRACMWTGFEGGSCRSVGLGR